MSKGVAILGLIIAVASNTAIAGGDSWQVKVLRVTDRGASSLVELAPVDRGAPWDGCATATVEASYKHEPLGRRTWSESLVTSSTQREAIQRLAAAAASGTIIRLGSMGSGVKASKSAKCTFESRGLALVEEFDGRKQVYSFHGAT